MKAIGWSSMFLPDQALPLLFVLGAIALMVGARRIASSLMLFALASALLPVILSPLFALIPSWVFLLVILYACWLVPFFAVRVFEWAVTPALGARTSSEMAGHLAADVARAVISAPFRFLGWAWRGLSKLRRIRS